MGLDKTRLPDRLVRLLSDEARMKLGLSKPCSERIISSEHKPAKAPKAHGARYSLPVVLAFFAECGLPEPVPEYRFDPDRKWRFDFAWPPENNETRRIALEVQGGLFSGGAHVRGMWLVKEHEKLNRAACLGWRILFVQPADLCLTSTTNMIRDALNV